MKLFTATVIREGKWWMVRVPEITGLTQARRLSDAGRMARELISVSLNVPVGEVEVTVAVASIGGIANVPERLAQIAADRQQAADLERQATREATELARALSDSGIPLRDVGAVLGVSHQRAHQLVSSAGAD